MYPLFLQWNEVTLAIQSASITKSIFHCEDHLTELDRKRLICRYIIEHALQRSKTVLFVRNLNLVLFNLNLEIPDPLFVLCYFLVKPLHQLLTF